MSQHEAWRQRLNKIQQTKRREKGLPQSFAAPSYDYSSQPVGSSLYVVRPGESYPSIANDKYGSEDYTTFLRSANPNSLKVHPGTILVLPDANDSGRVLANAEPDEFHRSPEYNEFLNQLDIDELALKNAFLAERTSPEFNDKLYLGFDQNDIGFYTTDNTALPLYYHPGDEEFPYKPEAIK